MRRFWWIISLILTIGGVLFAYGRRYISRLSFDVDFKPEIKGFDWNEGIIKLPLFFYVDNKNKKGITVKDLKLKIYDINNNLIAETSNPNNSYQVKGFLNNKFTHDFDFIINANSIKLLQKTINNEPFDLYIVASFSVFLIPVSVKEELSFNK